MTRIKVVSMFAALSTLVLTFSIQAQQTPEPRQEKPSGAQPGSSAPVKKKITESVAELEENSRQSYADGKFVRYYVANMKLHELRPYDPIYLENIIAACALVGRQRTAYHFLLKMQRQGFSNDLSKNPDTESIRQTEVWEYLNGLMIEAGVSSGRGDVVFTLPAELSSPAALGWDQSRGLFLVGTENDGAVVAVSQDGSTQVLIKANEENGLWAIRGFFADSENNRLWVSSAAVPAFSAYQASDKGRGALFEFDLETLELKGRYDVPADGETHELGPVAVSGNGDIYIADLAQPMVFRKTAKGDRLEAFVGNRSLIGLRDLAVSPDSGKLYIADSAMGIMVVDPAQQTSAMLTGPEDLNLGAISGLFYSKGKLIMIQNGFQPQRIMRLELDASGSNVVDVIPLAIALDDFDRPAFGMVKGEEVYYFANPGQNQPVKVLKTPLEPGNSIESAEMRKLKQKIKEAQ
jgi:sugar lactone lactonase YvrE